MQGANDEYPDVTQRNQNLQRKLVVLIKIRLWTWPGPIVYMPRARPY